MLGELNTPIVMIPTTKCEEDSQKVSEWEVRSPPEWAVERWLAF